MRKSLLALLFPLLLGGCSTFDKITKNEEEIKEIDTVYVETSSNPLDTLKGESAYIKAKEFFETAERFYEMGKDDSAKVYFSKGTKLLSQSNLSSNDYNFIDIRESLDNLERYKRQKEAIENGIELSKDEIEKIEQKFPIGEKFAKKVAYYEKLFETKKNEWFLSSFERFLQYEPYLDSLLKENNQPEIIKYMYPIESAMELSIKSKAGAKGIAQFMNQTGKLWGLEILGLWYDERLDPLKAIPASLKYLEYLLSDFQDPNLAIASYNCGEGRVADELRKFNSFNFDELLSKNVLPRETIEHLPKIYAYKDLSERTRLETPKKDEVLEKLLTNNFDTVIVRKQTSLNTIAKAIGIPMNELKSYNPAYGFDATPPEKMVKEEYAFEIRIPKGTREKFNEEYLKINEPFKFEAGSYVIKKGDTLSKIAAKFKISLYDLKKANGFPDPKKLALGRRLIIPER
ncbi:MAG: transglycosylase SLT domain-containing protein [archaeon]|nr:transglycosylase SLT domain-containing protein [archaeon]